MILNYISILETYKQQSFFLIDISLHAIHPSNDLQLFYSLLPFIQTEFVHYHCIVCDIDSMSSSLVPIPLYYWYSIRFQNDEQMSRLLLKINSNPIIVCAIHIDNKLVDSFNSSSFYQFYCDISKYSFINLKKLYLNCIFIFFVLITKLAIQLPSSSLSLLKDLLLDHKMPSLELIDLSSIDRLFHMIIIQRIILEMTSLTASKNSCPLLFFIH